MPAVALIDGLIHRNPSDTQLPRLPQAGPTTDSFRSLLERTSQSATSDRPEEGRYLTQEDSYRYDASDRSDDSRQAAQERVSDERRRENLRRAEERSVGAAEKERRASVADAQVQSESTAAGAAKDAESDRETEPEKELVAATEADAVARSPREESVVAAAERSDKAPQKNGEIDLSSRLEVQAKAAETKSPEPKGGGKAAARRAADGAGEPSGKLAELLKRLEPVETEAGSQERLATPAADKRDADAALRASQVAEGRDSQKAQAATLKVTGDHAEKGAVSELSAEDRELRSRTGRAARGEEAADRKVRVVDLRAPRAGERSGSGQERQENGGNQSGLKESGESALSADNRVTANRADGGESAFARQFGLTADSGKELGGQRIVQQQQLHRFLRESGYGEIVRNARVMLREGGNGEIRLNLSPKELGSVRVQLQLQDSHIAGRIIVENSTVREVIEQNLDQLQKAFQSQGLETGRLEVAVQERGEGQHRQDRGRPGRGGGARIFEEHTALVTESFYEDSQVNLMA